MEMLIAWLFAVMTGYAEGDLAVEAAQERHPIVNQGGGSEQSTGGSQQGPASGPGIVAPRDQNTDIYNGF